MILAPCPLTPDQQRRLAFTAARHKGSGVGALQPFLLAMLGAFLLSWWSDLNFHPDSLHRRLRRTLETKGWTVIRAGGRHRPRTITTRVVLEILCADLVIVEVSTGNPNVFYEMGFAHASGIDVLILSHSSALPFDVRVEQALIYDGTSEPGLRKLCRTLPSAAAADEAVMSENERSNGQKK